MNISAAVKTIWLGLLTSGKIPVSQTGIQITESLTSNFSYRTYSCKKESTPIILLHGLTRQGYNDHRLVDFANALARIGYLVVTPNLTALQNLDFDYSDVETAIQTVQKFSNQLNKKVGLMGFSFGGTYGLLAASNLRVNSNISFVLAGGAYYQLSNLMINTINEKTDKFSPSKAYARLSLLWKYQDKLELTIEQLLMYKNIVDNYCEKENHFTQEEIDFIQNLINKPNCKEIYSLWYTQEERFSRLELSNNDEIKNILAKVFLLHSQSDEDIPAEETIYIYNELVKNNIQPVIHITKDSGHVDFSKGNNIGLFSFFYKILKMD